MAYDLGVMFKILECVMWSTLMKVLGKNCFVYKCRARDLEEYGFVFVGKLISVLLLVVEINESEENEESRPCQKT
ncbi:hypothetical protein V1477_014928 [Vespula maculifrons]|uniref:Uncharacterized protein n=1 Tax=Vespula maculifrons TaxID=7453 RepID=A0ABD2BIU1_VESMC